MTAGALNQLTPLLTDMDSSGRLKPVYYHPPDALVLRQATRQRFDAKNLLHACKPAAPQLLVVFQMRGEARGSYSSFQGA